MPLDRGLVPVTHADPHHRLDGRHPHLAVADPAGLCRRADGLHHVVDIGVVDDDSIRIFGTSAMSYSAPR